MKTSKLRFGRPRIPTLAARAGALFVAFLLFCSRTATALDSSGAILVGYSRTDDVFDAPPVGYGVGVGARGGLTLPFHLYLGGAFVYHLGVHPSSSSSSNVWYLGAEGAYDIVVGPVTIRPYVGAGYAHWRREAAELCDFVPCGGGVRNRGEFAWWPGGAVLVDVGSSKVFVGTDVRYVMIPGLFEGNSLGGFLTGGMHF